MADQALASAAHEGEIDRDALRAEAGQLLRRLADHRRRGATLIYEAYHFDVGGTG
jgi:predicted nucleotide-binding protein (sugar kinase/HSP70/actin superfamily)